MIFDYIKTDIYFEDIKIKNKSVTKLELSKLGFLEYDRDYQIFSNEKLYKIELLSEKNDLENYINVKNYKTVIYIKNEINNIFICDIYCFPFFEKIDNLNIEINDNVFKKLKNLHFGKTLEEISDTLKKEITITINNFDYYLLVSYEDNEIGNSFLLPVNNFFISVITGKINDKVYLKTSKVLKKLPQKSSNFMLIKGSLSFESGLTSDKIAKDLENLINKENSYINTWDNYLKSEGEILLEKAKAIGEIKIKKIIPHENEFEIICNDIPEELSLNDSIAFYDNRPPFLDDQKFSVEKFLKLLEEKDIKQKIKLFFNIREIKENSIFIDNKVNQKELENKFLALSLLGDTVQVKRKLEARELIISGKSGLPFLGLIIEGENGIKKYQKKLRKNTIEPLSKYVKDKIFKNEPTQNQIKAIDIAVNTPDIAIIQGPPGTGKTTVITAIIERLNEIKNKNKLKGGEILITGYQHDAVINLSKRLSVNSLPAVKFGIKDEDEAIDQYEYILNWADEIVKKVKIDNFDKQDKIDNLERYIKNYLDTPTKETTVKILNNLSQIITDNIFNDEIEKIKSNFKNDIVFDIKKLKIPYALRTTEKGFEDDGKKRIEDLLNSQFINKLTKDEINKLKEKDIKYLEDYKKIRAKLIKTYYPKTIYQKPKPDENILNLINKIKEKLREGRTKKERINKVIYDYVNILKNNPFVLENMLKNYSFVYGSTTQQASNKEMITIKTENFFDTVIIDEAGRVPPMDLLIPMSRARKRIILVGDHRQLPHIVDEKIIKDIEKNTNIEKEYIKKSMFEYLKDVAKKLEEQDGIERVITLNNQYRTNPVMGKFISENFYEKYNEGFASPRPMEEFKHNLKGIENKPCVWIDVKKRQCQENSTKSKSRLCEAEKIVKYLKIWINSNEGKKLTYGIITFYKRQTEIIKELLEEELPDFYTKIRVGTVDAFQGMEFDVVFLSTVRSKKITKENPGRDFGFLVSKNRLNVSMSRQKKVLIVVGDKEYFHNEYAKSYVEELYNYIELCKKEGTIL